MGDARGWTRFLRWDQSNSPNEGAMADENDGRQAAGPTNLSLEDLDSVVGGVGAATTPTVSKDEQTELNTLQQHIDLGTESASSVLADAQAYAAAHGMMKDQMLVDLGQQL